MAKNYSSASFAILLLIVAAMMAPQSVSSYLTGQNLYTCWQAISAFEGCVTKAPAPEALNIHLRLTPQCCNSVRGIGEYCLSAIYPSFSFAPTLESLLKGICSDNFAPAPQPAAIDY